MDNDMTFPPLRSPHGARIRVAVPVALALLARLLPAIRPFRVLRTVDAYYNIGAAYMAGTAAVCLMLRTAPLTVFIATFLMGTLVGAHTRSGNPLNAVQRFCGLLYSDLTVFGVGLVFVAVVWLAWYLGSWWHVLAYVGARLASFALQMILEFRWGKTINRRFGAVITWQERYFFDAYCAAAIKLGIDAGEDVSEAELESGTWQLALEDIRAESPQYASRLDAI